MTQGEHVIQDLKNQISRLSEERALYYALAMVTGDENKTLSEENESLKRENELLQAKLIENGVAE